MFVTVHQVSVDSVHLQIYGNRCPVSVYQVSVDSVPHICTSRLANYSSPM